MNDTPSGPPSRPAGRPAPANRLSADRWRDSSGTRTATKVAIPRAFRFPVVLAGIWLSIASWAAAADDRPNILLILADDLGWSDVGYQGSDFHETPHIDALAREGMVFSHGYASAGNCAPSRACLMSGTYTPRHHVFAVGNTERGPKSEMRLRPVPNRSGLDRATITIAERLHSAGYATGIFGKWHLDGPDGAPPGEQGFDVVFDPRAPDPNRRRDAPLDPKGIHSINAAAIDFIAGHRQRPFFAFVSHHAIHTALESRPETLARFRAKPPGTRHSAPLYAACLKDFDDGVHRLLRALTDLGLEHRTLVVFTSDNGATRQSNQEPLRGSKGGYYEGGIRVPFIVRWPGVTQPGTTRTEPVIHVDLYPTFLEAAGIRATDALGLDGESLLPVLRDGRPPVRKAVFWHFPGYLDTPVLRGRDPLFRTRPVSVVREGSWKLLLYHEEWLLDGGRQGLPSNRAVELYHLGADPGEHNDLSASEPAQRDRLLDTLLEWTRSTGAPWPEPRTRR